MYMYVNVRTYVHIYMYVYVGIYLYVCYVMLCNVIYVMCVCMCVCLCVCMYVCMYFFSPRGFFCCMFDGSLASCGPAAAGSCRGGGPGASKEVNIDLRFRSCWTF